MAMLVSLNTDGHVKSLNGSSDELSGDDACSNAFLSSRLLSTIYYLLLSSNTEYLLSVGAMCWYPAQTGVQRSLHQH